MCGCVCVGAGGLIGEGGMMQVAETATHHFHGISGMLQWDADFILVRRVEGDPAQAATAQSCVIP